MRMPSFPPTQQCHYSANNKPSPYPPPSYPQRPSLKSTTKPTHLNPSFSWSAAPIMLSPRLAIWAASTHIIASCEPTCSIIKIKSKSEAQLHKFKFINSWATDHKVVATCVRIIVHWHCSWGDLTGRGRKWSWGRVPSLDKFHNPKKRECYKKNKTKCIGIFLHWLLRILWDPLLLIPA